MKTVVIVPAWNEEKTIGGVLDSLISNVDEVIVVNDGSTDRTSEIALGRGARVVSHVLNRGLGASLATGIVAALDNGAEVIVTFDADGQHLIEDLKKVITPIQSGDVDVVIGSRMLDASGMPFIRRVANRVGNEVTAILFGARVTDSQSGFRAFSRHAASRIQVKTDRMEVSSEIVAEIFRHKLSLLEVPIRAHYTEYSLSKGQGFLTGLRTLGRLIFRRTFR